MTDHEHSCTTGGVPDPTCEEAIRELYTFLDGELTEERRDQIAAHLDDCGPCARAADFEAELRVVVSSRCRDRVPEALVKRVEAALAAEEGPRPGQ